VTQSRILLLGANGQVGAELREQLERQPDRYRLHAFTRAEVDLGEPQQLRRAVADARPAIIVNAAAYTAVDRAESEPELATSINAKAPGILAEEAARIGALLVHYSTDYVFDGSKATPWLEEDAPAPLSVYGSTKLAGEQAIVARGGSYLIFRTSWVFAPRGRNFLLTVLRLARERDRLTIVDDQLGAPTSALAIAKGTLEVLTRIANCATEKSAHWSGVYNMTCRGETTWFGFTQAILEEAGALLGDKHPVVAPIATADYPTPAKRPANSVLNNRKLLDQFGVALPHWREATREVLAELIRAQ
jgi:dTDP-4-dehydrorhamnose reductase